MKKTILAVFVILGVFFLFLPAVSAHEDHEGEDDHCDCTIVTGPEKHKIVSEFLKSDAWKIKKKELKEAGYHWNGVNEAEVSYNPDVDANLVAVPILTPDRSEKVYILYAFGEVRGPLPEEAFH